MGGKAIDLSVKRELKAPDGFERAGPAPPAAQSAVEKRRLLQEKAWTLATSPASNVFMVFIMFWFIGSGANIYTLMMIYQLVRGQVTSFTSLREKFRPFERDVPQLGFYKLVYAAINAAVSAFVLYKVATIGLLPLFPSDYVDLLPTHAPQPRVAVVEL